MSPFTAICEIDCELKLKYYEIKAAVFDVLYLTLHLLESIIIDVELSKTY